MADLVGSYIITETKNENGEVIKKEYSPNLADPAMAEREALKKAEAEKASGNSENGGDNA